MDAVYQRLFCALVELYARDGVDGWLRRTLLNRGHSDHVDDEEREALMGQLRKRGGIWWIRYSRNGRRYEESAKTAKKETARDLLRRKEGDIANGMPITSKIGRVRFESASAAVVADYRLNERASIGHVERHVKRLGKYFAGWRLADLTGADVRAYSDARKTAGASNATINRELATLKRMYSLAIEGGRLLVKPKIKMLDENNARQGFFERDRSWTSSRIYRPSARERRRSPFTY